MPPRVLFVCVHNSCRSLMAEGFARHFGPGKVEAYSAGSQPCGDACPTVRAKRREDWAIADPKGKSPEVYRAARGEIARRVEDLLKDIAEE